MKKYKLIKEYPGSPELYTEFEYWTNGISEQIYNKSNNLSFISLKTVKDYPEFWEEVIEKDYEILSYYQESNVYGKYVYYKSNENWNYIEKQNYKIYSIKRLSDGEMFTVGDRITGTLSVKERTHKYVTIQKIYLKNNILHIGIDTGFIDISLCNDFEKINHFKQPIFQTEDGVDIFIGDISFGVNSSFKLSEVKHINDLYIYSDVKEFSTKEKAEEYILMNKPCLSLNDVFKVYPLYKKYCNSMTKHAIDLINLVKNKL